MATFGRIGIDIPTTIDQKAATVQVTRNSTVLDQEIVTLGDAESSLGVARVLAAAPTSTEYGLAVRIASGPSSVADLAVRAVLSSTTADNPVTATQGGSWTVRANISSTTADNPVTATQGGNWTVRSNLSSTSADNPVTATLATNLQSTAAVASNSSALDVRLVGGTSSAAEVLGTVRVTQSTAADLNVTVAGYSTTAQVSSVGGIVTVRPSDTNFASSAGFHFTSSGELTVNAAVTVSQLSPSDTNWASSAGFHFNSSGELLTVASVTTSTTVNVSSLAGAVIVRSSAADALVTATIGTNLQSTAATASNSSAFGVRLIGGTSSAAEVLGTVRVVQSSAAELNVTVAGYSTLVTATIGTNLQSTAAVASNSSALGVRLVGGTSSNAEILGTVRVVQSTAIELKASVSQASTVWQEQAEIQDSSGVGFGGSTTRPTTNAQGLLIRTILNDLNSTCFSTLGNNSTSSTVVSSAAGLRHKVFAYSITSTAQAINTLSFASSLANPIWHIQMQSISSGITGANLAVSPPAWLFDTEAGSPLVFKVTGSTGTYHVSFSYFSEA